MPPFVHTLDITDVHQIVGHFQNIPDLTEYILESDLYPLAALNEVLGTLYDAKDHIAPENPEFDEYTRMITKIESVIATRIDYVNSVIEHLLGRETFETPNLSLDHSPTKEILFHIDLMKDVAHSSEIDQGDYKTALRKLTKTLKFRFNKGIDVIKHNRKLAELLIDLTDDAALLVDLYQVLINLTTAEAAQIQKKSELSRMTLKNLQSSQDAKDQEKAQFIEIEKFKDLDISEKARELIKLSLYGLCEYLSKFSVEELQKYPIGILRSTEKILGDLEQHRLRTSDICTIQHSPKYTGALEIIKEALATYDSSDKKYNFVDIYRETDYTVDRVTYCVFNDVILRVIQNITEAYFVVDSKDQDVSQNRLSELQVTIVERYKTEWTRQNELRA
jgi:hypothetical protein